MVALTAPVTAAPDAAPAHRVLEVDRTGSGPYKTLTSAASIAQPGDTIKVKPNTGPYREILRIMASGTADAPIIFDGGGNVITGFEPLTAWEEHDGVTSCKIKFPCVITYKGERLRQDFTTGQFTKYADLNDAKDTLTLRAGVSKEGWEVSTRAFAVLINNVSHQIYRNVRASGSTNDGFNLHGASTDLVFENIEGFNNFDEGFSSHDSIQSIVRGGKFWGNDNGIANSYVDKDTVSTTLENVDLYDNLGFGLVLHDCNAKLDSVRAWNNAVRQMTLSNANMACTNVIAYTPTFTKRIWQSYTESKMSSLNGPSAPYIATQVSFTGTPPVLEKAAAPTGAPVTDVAVASAVAAPTAATVPAATPPPAAKPAQPVTAAAPVAAPPASRPPAVTANPRASATLAASTGTDQRPVIYEWNPANFHPAPEYPVKVAPTADGTRYLLTTTGLGYNHILVAGTGKLKVGHDYTAIIQYEVVKSTEFPNSFYMFARSRKLGTDRDVWRTWLGEPGMKGVATLPVTIKDSDDWLIYVGDKGPGQIIIDSFKIVEGFGYTYIPATKSAAPAKPAVAKAGTTAAKSLPTGCAPFTIEPPRAQKPAVTLSTADFNLVADPPVGRVTEEVANANMAAIKAALAACREKKASTLLIPKGIYRFGTNDSVPLLDLTDLTIDGQGSEFIFQKLHQGNAVITAYRDTRCILKNLIIDWDWTTIPLASLCRVVATTADGTQADLTFPDLTPVEVEKIKTSPWQSMIPMEPDTFRMINRPRVSGAPSKFETVNDNTLRVTFKAAVQLTVGDTFCVRHMYYEMGAFRIGDISDFLFDNVTIYSMPGMGFFTLGDAHNWGFRNCRVVRRPGTRRPFATTADGFHVGLSQGNLLLDGCEFTQLGDDCINIHDNVYEGLLRVDDHTLTLVGPSRFRIYAHAGDTIELRHADYSALGYSSKVTAASIKGTELTVTLADPLPANVLPQTIFINTKYNTSNVKIVNCRLHDTGGRGMLLGVRNATIENNTFDHVRGTAVQLETEIVDTLWAEGYGAENIVIRNNVFDTTNTIAKFDGAIIYGAPRTPAGPTGYPLFRDILIDSNRFINCPGPAVSLNTCKNITVSNNLIENNSKLDPVRALSASIAAFYSTDINVTGNKWLEGSPSAQPGVVYDPATTTNITSTDNVTVPTLPAVMRK
jgi:hypothetical protein